MLKQYAIPLTVVLVIVAIGTWKQAVSTDRFTWIEQDLEQLDNFTKRLEHVPLEVGNWVGELKPFNEDQFLRSKCKGWFF